MNDKPALTVPASIDVTEDISSTLSGISINDVDAESNPMTLTLTVSKGTINISDMTGLTKDAGDNGTNTITVSGTQSALNTALTNLDYTSDLNVNGTDTLVVTVNDNGNIGSGGDKSDSENITINIEAVNDDPVLTVPASIDVTEDISSTLSGISINDVDAEDKPMTLTLTVSKGSINISDMTGLTKDAGDNNTDTITVTGTLAALNTALTNLDYISNSDVNGTDTLVVTVNDNGNIGSGGDKSDSENITINIEAVNDDPILTVPGDQTVNEDEALNITGISIADIDEDETVGAELTLTLEADNGNLIFSANLGALGITATGNGTQTVSLTGSLTNLNTALGSLMYQGLQHFNGIDNISLIVNDQGNTGTGGSLTDAKDIKVTVEAINDAPTLSIPASITTNEDVEVSISGLSITDVDADETVGSKLVVVLNVSNGALTFSNLTGVEFLSGANGNDAMQIRGSLTDLNNALASLSYKGLTNYNGPDTLFISVNDQGNTGDGGPKSSNETIAITVNAVADTPFLEVTPISGTQGQTQALNIVATPGAPGETLRVTINGLPTGSSLSAGTQVGDSWVLNQAELAGLTLTLLDSFASTFDATVTALSIDGQSVASATSILSASIDERFIIPNENAAPSSFGVSIQGVNSDPANDPFFFSGNTLEFILGASSLEFDENPLSQDALGIIAGFFNLDTEIDSEVADAGPVIQEVEDKKVYDLSPLDDKEQKFILDLLNATEEDEEKKIDDDLSFITDDMALEELTSSEEIDDPITQKYLDTRVSLEDTLQGEFDCLNNS